MTSHATPTANCAEQSPINARLKDLNASFKALSTSLLVINDLGVTDFRLESIIFDSDKLIQDARQLQASINRDLMKAKLDNLRASHDAVRTNRRA